MLDENGLCPKCGTNWDGGDIYEYFRTAPGYEDKTEEEILETAGNYGWTPETPKRFSNLIGIEILGGYDGISMHECPQCKTRWDRWTGEEII